MPVSPPDRPNPEPRATFVVRLINLDRSTDRLASFRTNNPDLPIRRVSAVDGGLLEREACIQGGLITETNRYTPPALGIAASHVALWQACATGTEPFHIAEDDAIFHPDFVGFAGNNLSRLGDWDAVFWGFNFDWPIEIEFMPSIGPAVMLFNQEIVRHQLGAYRKSRFQPALAKLMSCAGTCAYSISPSGARRYLACCLPIGNNGARFGKRDVAWANSGLDVEMSRHHASLATYVCLPPLAVTPNDAGRSTAR
jgi:GR25 family glycosyltransferase involved in LPS biosynthesis